MEPEIVSITLRLFRRTVIFTFFLFVAYVALFFAGNYQDFLPGNVSLILTLTMLVATVLFFSSVISMLLTVLHAVRTKNAACLVQLIFFAFTAILSSAFVVLARSLSILTEGF